MVIEQLKDFLSKVPVIALLAAYALYLGYDYYEFTHDPSSPLMQKQQQVEAAKKQELESQDKLKKAKEFYATLEARRGELRNLALQLNGLKATLSETLDLGSFIETVVKEAGKVGLSVQGIKPSELKESEYYTEQAFDMSFHGFYVQLTVFLDHLANLERIIRVDKFTVKASSPATSQFVDLEGTLQLKSFQYKGTKADEVVKPDANSSTQGTSSTTAPSQSTIKIAPIASTGNTTTNAPAPASTPGASRAMQNAPVNSARPATPSTPAAKSASAATGGHR